MKTKRLLVGLGVISATLLGSTLVSTPSYAADANAGTGSSMINVGPILGVGFLNKDLGTQLVLGAEGDYKLMPNVAVGGYFTYNSVASFPGISSSLFTIAPQASYVLENVGVLNGTRVGVKAGLGIAHVGSGTFSLPGGGTATSAGDNTLSFVFGPHVAYDYALGGGLTVGGEANYMIYTANDGFNAFNLLGALKYWF